MTDVYKYDHKIIKNTEATNNLHQTTIDCLQQFAPTHFLSVQFPTTQRSYNLDKSLRYLKSVMKTFQKSLTPRHWNRKHLPFIAFAENTSGPWHFHIFLKNNRYTDTKLLSGISQTMCKFKFSKDVLNLKPIITTPHNAYFYANKEIYADLNYHFNSSRIILSTDLFNIDSKHIPNHTISPRMLQIKILINYTSVQIGAILNQS